MPFRRRHFQVHFREWKCLNLIEISLKFVPKGLINNIPALVQKMAWRHPGDKPLSEPMMEGLLTHICVTRPQWVNGFSTRRVDMECIMTSSNGNIFRVTGHLCGEFTGPRWIPAQRPVTRSFVVFFDLSLNKCLSKQSWGWWFETPSCPLWRHCNV